MTHVKLHVHDPGAVGTIQDQTIIGKCPAVTKGETHANI